MAGILDFFEGKKTGVLQNVNEGILEKDLTDVGKTKLIGM